MCVQRANQEHLIDERYSFYDFRKLHDGYEKQLISRQRELEDCGLKLEEYILELQRSKRSITKEDSFEYDGNVKVQRESQEELLELKRKLHDSKTLFEKDEEERVRKQYTAQKETSERLMEKYKKLLDHRRYILKRLNAELPVNFIISRDGLILGFNGCIEENDTIHGGDLVAVFDAYQNQAAIVYDNGRITRIADPDGNESRLEYNSLGQLSTIIDFRDRRTTYEYDDGRLVQIKYQNGEETHFDYKDQADEDLLTHAIPPSELSIIFEYTNGKVTKISDVKEERVTIEYISYLTTRVTDIRTDANATYTFDEDGDCQFECMAQDGVLKGLVTYDNDEDDRGGFVLSKNKVDDDVIDEGTPNYFGNKVSGNDVSMDGTGTAKKAEWIINVSQLNNFDDHATDYMLYGFARAAASLPINGVRKTAYCECSKTDDPNIANVKFELRAKVDYDANGNDFDEFIVSFDHKNANRQIAAIPITLREVDENDVLPVKPVKITITADYSNNQGIAIFERPNLSAGEWVYSVFDAERNKTQEYVSERTTDKIENGNVTGRYKVRSMRNFSYDDRNNLIKDETTVRREEWSVIEQQCAPDITQMMWNDKKSYVTTYEYNKHNKLIRAISPKDTVSETVYDSNGRAVRNVSYHLSNPVDKFCAENEISEKGQVIAETDETGENKTRYDHIEGTNIVKRITLPNGQTISFGHDPHTDDVLGISAIVDDVKNSTVLKYSKKRTSMDCGNSKIEYTYDEYGRENAVMIDGKEYVSFEYIENDGGNGNDIVVANYADGESYKTITDRYGKLLEVQHDDGSGIFRTELQNVYDEDDKLIKTIDLVAKETTNYEYDEDDNVIKQTCGNVEIIPRYNVTRNEQSTLFRISVPEHNGNKIVKIIKEITYTDNYDDEGELVSVELPTGDIIKADNDDLGRITKTETPVANIEYGYLQKDDHATGIVNRHVHRNKNGTVDRIRYFYDVNGNVKEIRNNGKLVSRYRYDGLNRIIREDNADLDKTETYEYDGNGNILYRTAYKFTVSDVLPEGRVTEYVYDGDRLIEFNNETIGYDENNLPGNPSSYLGKQLQWGRLRDLQSIDDIQFKYNFAGLRITKENDNRNTRYHWSGDRLLAERRTVTTSDAVWDMLVDEELPIYTDSKFIQYIQGPNGTIGLTVKRNDDPEETYYYRRNLQGDVTHICNVAGELKARYIYDAWGNHAVLDADGNGNNDAEFIGNINPIRYRGYYYDVETNLYYLRSRYYDPQTCRFINADSISELRPGTINGLNLYAYCGSNPVMMIDPTGRFSIDFGGLWKGFTDTVGGLWGGVTDTVGGLYGGFVETVQGGVNWLFTDPMGQFLLGALIIIGLGVATVLTGGTIWGVILGAAFYGALTGAAIGLVVGGIAGGIGSVMSGGSFWDGAFRGAASGFMWGAIGGAITGGALAGANIGLGGVTIIGTAQNTKTAFHATASNIQAGKMAMQIGRYSTITLNRALNTAGLSGRRLPDVIGVARRGKNLLVEVTSKSQTHKEMATKLGLIRNPQMLVTSRSVGTGMPNVA